MQRKSVVLRAVSFAAKRKADETIIIEKKQAKRQELNSYHSKQTEVMTIVKAAPFIGPSAKSNIGSRPDLTETPVPDHNSPSSAISSSVSPSLVGTRQSDSATKSIVQTAYVYGPILPAPDYNPAACFNQAVPDLYAPWPHGFPAPTPRYTQPLTSCPVDWKKIPHLRPEQIEAYKLRAPWNPNPVIFESIAQQAQRVRGKVPSEECVRKRFMKACLAVFKCSGVYFEETALGLDAYGVPKQHQLNRLIKHAKSKAAAEGIHATTHISTSNSLETPRNPARLIQATPKRREADIYAGEVIAFQLQPDHGNPPVIRVCDKRLIPDYYTMVDNNVASTIDDESHNVLRAPILPFSANAFDYWHSSICFGHRRTFPQRTYICKEIAEGQYMLRDQGKLRNISIGMMIETYCLSRVMGTTVAAGMMLDAIVRKLDSSHMSALHEDDVATLQYLTSGDPLFNAIDDFLVQAAREFSPLQEDA